MPFNTRRNSMSGGAMPLSYVNSTYREPSAWAGSNVLGSQPGLARPVLNATGGMRRMRKRSTRKRSTRKGKRSTRKRSTRKGKRHGGFYPGVMGPFLQNATRLVPATVISGYKMVKNYKRSRSNRSNKNRK